MGENAEQRTTQHQEDYPLEVSFPPARDAGGEINLIDLVETVVKRRAWVLATTAIVTALATGYAVFMPAVYRASVVFLPPTEINIKPLKVSGANAPDKSDVYAAFKLNVVSRAVRRSVFEEFDEPAESADTLTEDERFAAFNRNVSVHFPESRQDQPVIPSVTLAVTGSQAERVAGIANRLAEQAERTTVKQLVEGINAELTRKKEDLKRSIELLRAKTVKLRRDRIEVLKSSDDLERKRIEDRIRTARAGAKTRRLNRIAVLEEAAAVARALGVNESMDFYLKKIDRDWSGDGKFITDIRTKGSELYMRGYESLEAEIAQLKNRRSDDPFIAELVGLQQKLALLEQNREVEQLAARDNDDPFIHGLRDQEAALARLEAIRIDPAEVHAARIDQWAFPTGVGPSRRLIVAEGVVLGLILGCVTALTGGFIERYRSERA